MTIIYVKRDDATMQLPTRQAVKLIRELRAGRGQAEICRLLDNGYCEFIAVDGEAYSTDSMTLELIGATN
jgi:hypothetical protein